MQVWRIVSFEEYILPTMEFVSLQKIRRGRWSKKPKAIKILSTLQTIQGKECMLFWEENSILKNFKHSNL